jgi:hypothetical protein
MKKWITASKEFQKSQNSLAKSTTRKSGMMGIPESLGFQKVKFGIYFSLLQAFSRICTRLAAQTLL